MRISDWSSDVCSSDLDRGFILVDADFRARELDRSRDGAASADEAEHRLAVAIEGREHRLLVEFRALPEFEVEMARKGQIFKIILFLARSRERRPPPARGRSLAGGSSPLETERAGPLAEHQATALLPTP